MSHPLWAIDNLTAWEVVPWDERRRIPEERAVMLEGLGIRGMAYDYRAEHVASFDDELDALARHGIRLDAWWSPTTADDPLAAPMIDLFRRHGVSPELWVMQGPGQHAPPPAPPGLHPPADVVAALTGAERRALHRAQWRHSAQTLARSFTKTPEEQEQRVADEARRIRGLVELGARSGSRVQLYAHNGWFGMTDNQVAVIERLAAQGITDVGMVYNFHHARDEFHDDTIDFAPLWERMRPHVTTVNLNGTAPEGEPLLHPSQGDAELEMMRVIQESGWRGRVGVTGEIGGDMAETLRDALTGIAWCAAELAEPGSGGPRPVLPTSEH